MHVTTKEVDDQGVHILSSTVEADGPFEIASPKAKLSAEVIAIRRTDSGGVFLQTALTITEPQPEAAPAPVEPEKMPTPDELATAYLKEKGMDDEDAAAAIERFGAAKILAKKNEEREAELDALLSPPGRGTASTWEEPKPAAAAAAPSAPQLVPAKPAPAPPAPKPQPPAAAEPSGQDAANQAASTSEPQK